MDIPYSGTKVLQEEGGYVSAWSLHGVCLRGGSGKEGGGGCYAAKSIWPNFCFMAVQFCVPDVMPSFPF